MEATDFLISEEGVRHPNLAGIGHGQILDFS